MLKQDFLHKKLDERKNENALRALKIWAASIDFCSNDYLGIAKNELIGTALKNKNFKHGSTGSRLLSGNYSFIEKVEEKIAKFHDSEAALIFNSGYDANVGFMASIAQKGDTIIYDQFVHASIRDGIRLSFAHSFSFLHNDVNDLKKKLENASGNVFVVTETVFSMDGDICPMAEIVALCNSKQAHLILDEAHAIGVVGEKGEGLAQHLQLHKQCLARVFTYGKACGCHGAAVVGSAQLRSYLVNFARSFIYTTALPEISVAAIESAYSLFPIMKKERDQLSTLISQFQNADIQFEKLISNTSIQAVVIPGNTETIEMATRLQQNRLDIRPILYPTVPKGKERLRIVLHSFNKATELEKVIALLSFKN